MSTFAPQISEAVETFGCFGGTCTTLVQGFGPAGSAADAAARAKRRLLDWHDQFSRFDPASELSTLNRDPRACVPVSATMALFVQSALDAASMTDGLVDPTLVTEVEQAGYTEDLTATPVALADALVHAPARRPATPSPAVRWQQVSVDVRGRTVTRPPGVRLDSGGIVKGLFADVLASVLGGHDSFAVVAAGDIRFGGTAEVLRPIQVASPVDGGALLHTFELTRGAVATSGMSKRSWVTADGRPAHHIIDPGTGQPAFTGVLQATALAPSGVEAEALAKAALLSGPQGAAAWLRHGGVLHYEDGTCVVIEPRTSEGLR
jgi:thiamine biosynthesis lipoprotein